MASVPVRNGLSQEDVLSEMASPEPKARGPHNYSSPPANRVRLTTDEPQTAAKSISSMRIRTKTADTPLSEMTTFTMPRPASPVLSTHQRETDSGGDSTFGGPSTMTLGRRPGPKNFATSASFANFGFSGIAMKIAPSSNSSKDLRLRTPEEQQKTSGEKKQEASRKSSAPRKTSRLSISASKGNVLANQNATFTDFTQWNVLAYPEEEDSVPAEKGSEEGATSSFRVIRRTAKPDKAKKVPLVLAYEKLGLLKQEIRRQEVIFELLGTEKDYIRDLKIICDLFLKKIRDNRLLTHSGIKIVFSNIEELVKVNELFYKNLFDRRAKNIEDAVAAMNDPKLKGNAGLNRAAYIIQSYSLGDVLNNTAPFFRLYNSYCATHTEGTEYLLKRISNANRLHSNSSGKRNLKALDRKLASKNKEILDEEEQLEKDKDLALFLQYCSFRPECRNLNLISFLLQPIQRICKYPLLIREILKNTERNHADYNLLTRALVTIEKVVSDVNERRRYVEGQQVRLVELRKSLIFDDALRVGSLSDGKAGVFDLIGEASRKILSESSEQGELVELVGNPTDFLHLSSKNAVPSWLILCNDILVISKCKEKSLFGFLNSQAAANAKAKVKFIFKLLDILLVTKGYSVNHTDKGYLSGKKQPHFLWSVTVDTLGKSGAPTLDRKTATFTLSRNKEIGKNVSKMEFNFASETEKLRDDWVAAVQSAVDEAKKDKNERARIMQEKASKSRMENVMDQTPKINLNNSDLSLESGGTTSPLSLSSASDVALEQPHEEDDVVLPGLNNLRIGIPQLSPSVEDLTSGNGKGDFVKNSALYSSSVPVSVGFLSRVKASKQAPKLNVIGDEVDLFDQHTAKPTKDSNTKLNGLQVPMQESNFGVIQQNPLFGSMMNMRNSHMDISSTLGGAEEGSRESLFRADSDKDLFNDDEKSRRPSVNNAGGLAVAAMLVSEKAPMPAGNENLKTIAEASDIQEVKSAVVQMNSEDVEINGIAEPIPRTLASRESEADMFGSKSSVLLGTAQRDSGADIFATTSKSVEPEKRTSGVELFGSKSSDLLKEEEPMEIVLEVTSDKLAVVSQIDTAVTAEAELLTLAPVVATRELDPVPNLVAKEAESLTPLHSNLPIQAPVFEARETERVIPSQEVQTSASKLVIPEAEVQLQIPVIPDAEVPPSEAETHPLAARGEPEQTHEPRAVTFEEQAESTSKAAPSLFDLPFTESKASVLSQHSQESTSSTHTVVAVQSRRKASNVERPKSMLSQGSGYASSASDSGTPTATRNTTVEEKRRSMAGTSSSIPNLTLGGEAPHNSTMAIATAELKASATKLGGKTVSKIALLFEAKIIEAAPKKLAASQAQLGSGRSLQSDGDLFRTAADPNEKGSKLRKSIQEGSDGK